MRYSLQQIAALFTSFLHDTFHCGLVSIPDPRSVSYNDRSRLNAFSRLRTFLLGLVRGLVRHLARLVEDGLAIGYRTVLLALLLTLRAHIRLTIRPQLHQDGEGQEDDGRERTEESREQLPPHNQIGASPGKDKLDELIGLVEVLLMIINNLYR